MTTQINSVSSKMSFQQSFIQIKDIRKKIKKLFRKKQAKIASLKAIKLKRFALINSQANNVINSHQKVIHLPPNKFKYFDDSEMKELQAMNSQAVNGESNSIRPFFESLSQSQKQVPCTIALSDQQMPQCEKTLRVQNPGIQLFWSNVIKNTHYSEILTAFDLCFLQFLRSVKLQLVYIQQQSLTPLSGLHEDSRQACRMQLQIEILAGHSVVPAGTYKRILSIDNSGIPYQYAGEHLGNSRYKRIKKGLFKILFTDTYEEVKLQFISEFLKILQEEIIPYSLDYYLKVGQEKQEHEDHHQSGDEKDTQRNNCYPTMG